MSSTEILTLALSITAVAIAAVNSVVAVVLSRRSDGQEITARVISKLSKQTPNKPLRKPKAVDETAVDANVETTEKKRSPFGHV